MTPLMMRIFTLVGIALMAASMQMRARAEGLGSPAPQQLHAHAVASQAIATLPGQPSHR